MQVEKGYRYRVNGPSDLNEFALGILALTNSKSQYPKTIIDIHTFNDSNVVAITVYAESEYKLDKYIESKLGKIFHTEEIEIITIGDEEFNKEAKKEVEKISNNYLEKDGNDYIVVYDMFY